MLSYSKGPDGPLIEQTIGDTFRKTAARFPYREALVVRHQNVRFTFAELAREVDRVACGLASLGLRAGDRVGVWSTNCVEWVLLHLASARSGVVLVHSRGRPSEWKQLPQEGDIVPLVAHDLANCVQIALDSGLERPKIVLDPGFGFGKRFEENYPLLAHLERLQRLGFPLLVATSRKSFIARTLGKRRGENDAPPGGRLHGSLAAMVAAILHGAHIVRVHDVRAAVEAAAIADEVLAASA